MTSSRGSSHKYLISDQGLPLGFDTPDGATLRISQQILDAIEGRNGLVHPVSACLSVLSIEFKEFQPTPEIPVDQTLKERAIYYYVHGPSATFAGNLLERAWLWAIEDYVGRVLQWKVRFHFETIDPYVVPRWHVSYMPGEEETA